MKIKQLNEQRARVIRRTNGDNRGYYSSKKTSSPFVAVYPSENNFKIVSITKAGIQDYEILQRQQRQYDYDLSASEEKSLYAFRHYNLLIDFDFEKSPEYFTVLNTDLAGLFKSLMTTHRISPALLVPTYGEMPSMDDDEQFGDVTIMLAGTISKSNLKKIKMALTELKKHLALFSLESLVEGKFRIAKCSGNAVATYQYGSSITTVCPTLVKRTMALPSLIHEMGHKWEDMAGIKNVVDKKYQEMQKAGNRFTSVPDVDIGDEIVVISPAYKRLHGYVFKVVKINDNSVDARGYNAKINATVEIDIPMDTLFSSNAFTRLNGSPISPKTSNEWFPTQYSTVNAREFFAENFMNYVAGTASDEVREWMNSLPRTK